MLSDIAHGRSGDKGNHANIAVIAYNPQGYEWLKANLTVEVVCQYFRERKIHRAERYEAPNLLGLNFMLYDVLEGGASRSLLIDTQGKSLAYHLLQMPIEIPDEALKLRNPQEKIPS
ncbi:hypothetical protein KIH39_04385 [Telmatocola sphagniphila]|uniref:AtuA-like ferredoxin-fold domain-containing protein n=2 Tax=Telmatocola sphagniphila TaxID=1123043 RepID=A0A8E6BAE4_9BACT|nr:hypothetical protein KIH39_04385 [Telmatocola sphagniphila]